MSAPESPTLTRLSLAARAAGLSLAQLAAKADVSETHLRECLAGRRRAGVGLIFTLRALVGDAGWAYACGRSDNLPPAAGAA